TYSFSIFLFLLLFSACQDPSTPSQKQVQEIEEDGAIRNSDIIRNPITANAPVDTSNIAKMTFTETTYDFGTVNEGDEVRHTFHFQNTGKAPLLISDARSTCGCTVPEYPKNPIPPGGSGAINVLFRTKGKQNQQQKPVTITANTLPSNNVIYLNGIVQPKSDQ
ncbi:MAG: DUF1573 domain-containing protein, partial [Cyanobacteria bacterium P01_F01_bin.153]